MTRKSVGRGARLGWACGAAVLLCAGVAQAVTIGNVSSFTTSGQDITFSISDGSKVRLSILAPDLVRVRIAPGGTIGGNVSQAVAKTSWATAAFSPSDSAGSVTFTTSKMKLVVLKTPFVLECRDLSNNLILSDDPTRRIQWDSGKTKVFKTTQSGEKYLGLGWRTLGLVRNGSTFTMRNVPNYGSNNTFYSGVPFWYGMRNGSVYGLFFDDTSWGTIDVGATSGSYMSFENLGGQADYYYFAGPSMPEVLDRFTELTGRPYMPPRWSLGYQQCRWSYVPQSQVLDIANQLRTRSIPCDVMYLDIDYMPGGVALTFDPAKFSNAAGMLTTLHNQGFKVVANISPFLFTHDSKFATAVSGNYVLRKADNSVLYGWHDYWAFVGGAPNQSASLAWLDFSKSSTRAWWAAQHVPFLSLGIDGIWNDLNEPDDLGMTGGWPADVKYNFDGNPVNHNKTSTQYALLQTKFSYEVLAAQYANKRPFVLSRGGYAGLQRYSALWSGDNGGDWTNDYKRNIPMGLSLSISGNPHNGHDIGGFFGHPTMNDKPSGELYARWMQSGVFSPFCRQHHDGFGNRANPARPFVEPWQFGTTVENICRDYIGLRYRLMPYLYTLFYEAHVSGAPVQRPTVYDFPADATTLTQNYDFMVGPSLLVSPVTTAGATNWTTYLPAGTQWINWWDDSLKNGGANSSVSAPLDRIPIYVRGGAIIPTGPVYQYEGQTTADTLTIEAYPLGAAGSFTMYEDDGISWAYQSGTFCKTAFSMSGSGDTFTFGIAARTGSFVPPARKYVLKIHRWPGHTKIGSLNGVNLTEHASKSAFDASVSGYFHDATAGLMWAKFTDSGGEMTFAFTGTPVPVIPGDFDLDLDVDMEDFGRFQLCLSGAGIQQLDPACQKARLDGDMDVDQDDLIRFIGCFSGPSVPGNPNCLP